MILFRSARSVTSRAPSYETSNVKVTERINLMMKRRKGSEGDNKPLELIQKTLTMMNMSLFQ